MGLEDNFFKKPKPEPEKNEEPKITRREFLLKGSIIAGSLLGIARGVKTIDNLMKDGEGFSNLKKRKKAVTGKENGRSSKAKQEKKQDSEKVSEKNRAEFIEKELKTAHDWCEFFLEKYYELSRDPEIFPSDIFTDDFFIAIQLTESKGKTKEVSSAGATGLMQIMASAVRDVPEFLTLLRKKGKTKYDGIEKFDKEKHKKLVEAIRMLSMRKPDYNRAIGKLYFMNLFDRYKIGKKYYEKGDIRNAWKFLAAAYNQGPNGILKAKSKQTDEIGCRYKPERLWTKQSRKYYKKVISYIEELESIEEAMVSMRIITRTNYAKILLARELEVIEKDNIAKERGVGKYNALKKYLEAIKKIEEKIGQRLTDNELNKLICRKKSINIIFNKKL